MSFFVLKIMLLFQMYQFCEWIAGVDSVILTIFSSKVNPEEIKYVPKIFFIVEHHWQRHYTKKTFWNSLCIEISGLFMAYTNSETKNNFFLNERESLILIPLRTHPVSESPHFDENNFDFNKGPLFLMYHFSHFVSEFNYLLILTILE